MRKKAILILLLVAAVFLSGCVGNILSFSEDEDLDNGTGGDFDSQNTLPGTDNVDLSVMRPTVLYYADENYQYLVPLMRFLPRVEGIGRQAVEQLVDCPEVREALSVSSLQPVLPPGTTIRGLTIRDKLAIIDFSKELLNYEGKDKERLIVDSVVWTLTEFPTVDRVQIWVEGRERKTLPEGTRIDKPLSRERGINLEVSDEVANLDNVDKVTLYFTGSSSDGSFIYFVPVTRVIPKSDDILQDTLKELIKGPAPQSNLFCDIPRDTRFLGSSLRDGVITVNFSSELVHYGGTDAENSIIGSIVLTLTEFPDVDKVAITVDGKNTVFPEGTEVSKPISRPQWVNPYSF